MNLDLCKELQVRRSGDGFVVCTPFKYYDNDNVVVFAWPNSRGVFRVSDNGEAAERLSMDGIDVSGDRIDRWIGEAKVFFKLNWDEEDQSFWVEVDEGELAAAVFRVAEAASQLQAMTVVRSGHAESTFKAEVMAMIREVASETGVSVKFDVPVVSNFTADALFLADTRPLAVVVAQSKDRLMEAELMWSNAKRLGDPTRVIAVVESSDKVGRKEVERAQFYTDKTLTFRNFGHQVREKMIESLSSI